MVGVRRRATVSPVQQRGELHGLRLHADVLEQHDLRRVGTNGLGDRATCSRCRRRPVRADNSIGYFRLGPPVASTAAHGRRGRAGSSRSTRTTAATSVVAGFAAGPFDVAGVRAAARLTAPGPATITHLELGGSWDFGFGRSWLPHHDKNDLAKEDRGSISGVIPLGQGEIHVATAEQAQTRHAPVCITPIGGGLCPGFDNTIWQGAVTYQYNLSKRTAVYGTYSQIGNDDRSQASVASGTSSPGAPKLGGDSKGVEFGIRHFF